MTRKLYNSREVAEMVGRHVNDVYRWVARGFIRGKRLNGRGSRGGRGQLVFEAREVDRFIANLPDANPPKRKPVREPVTRRVHVPGTGEVIEIC